MSAPPDQELLQAIAAELGVDPSFVEKDWHAMRLANIVNGVRQGNLRPVFCGGTSLSKGYGLIQRFSEDLDFKLLLPEAGIERAVRRRYRTAPVERVMAALDILATDFEYRNEYERFVGAMCYGNESETPAFESALEAVHRLGQILN